MTALLAAACGGSDGPTGPTSGAILVTSSVRSTVDNATFDYGITIDNGTPRTVNASGAATYVVAGLATGSHSVAVQGLAAGCTVATPSQNVTVRGGDTARVTFDIGCTRTSGDLTVTAVTTGVELDADGYSVLIDGVAAGTVTSNGTTTLRSIAPGARTITLSGLATNCSATVPSRAVTVAVGGTATAAFDITCRSRTGVIRLAIATTGDDIDPNGYLFYVDNLAPIRVTPNGAFRLTGVPPGPHDIYLADIGNNCALLVPGDQRVTVREADTTVVTLPVSCLARNTGTSGPTAFAVTDPGNDTLPNTRNATAPAIDLLSTSGRYAPGWMTFTLRFKPGFVPTTLRSAASLVGFIEIDLDENSNTGYSPTANSYGGNSIAGIDASIDLDADSTTAVVLVNNVEVGRAGLRYGGDSIVLTVPLSLLSNDDGNMRLSSVWGTLDRATDIGPNAGVILARRPALLEAATATLAPTLSLVSVRMVGGSGTPTPPSVVTVPTASGIPSPRGAWGAARRRGPARP